MSLLYILVGVSGSGKSTRANEIVDESCICEADTYPGLYVNGQLQRHLLSEAHSACQSKVKKLMMSDTPVIVQSNTNLNVSDMIPYLQLADQFSYRIRIEYPWYDLIYWKNNLSRPQQTQFITNVRSKGQKQVPEFIIKSMIEKYDVLFPYLVSWSPLDDPKIVLHRIYTEFSINQ
jgi:predicted kinase